MGDGYSKQQLSANSQMSQLDPSSQKPTPVRELGQLDPGLHSDWYGPKVKLLILQSAGNVVHEGVATEDDDAETYLTGSAINVGLVQNHFIAKGLPQSNITIENFSVCNDKDPREVVKRFLSSNRDKKSDLMIYYTGHGDMTGAWHFTLYGQENKKVVVSPVDVREWLHASDAAHCLPGLVIMSQSCYSGKWAEEMWNSSRGGVLVYSSASKFEPSFSTPTGSEWTKWKFGDGRFEDVRSSPHYCYKRRPLGG